MTKQNQRGYNLIELLVAIAILGVVLMSILSLFLWGRKNVYSGKQMTTAIAVGTRVMEDLQPLSNEDIYEGVFAISDSVGGSTIKYGNPQKEYTNAAIRSTKALTGYTDVQKENPNGPMFLTKGWKNQLEQTLIDGTTKKPLLDDGAVTVIMMPRAGETSPAKFGDASVMQIRVIVSWLENRRQREVILDTVKAQ
ncbi:MAG TPA: prepilin-type N-terminal cleavage/methylation domain-containing protein [Thermoanaerobaculia bacterium]